jgi:hypothetical protein
MVGSGEDDGNVLLNVLPHDDSRLVQIKWYNWLDLFRNGKRAN